MDPSQVYVNLGWHREGDGRSLVELNELRDRWPPPLPLETYNRGSDGKTLPTEHSTVILRLADFNADLEHGRPPMV
jgi:hypothetical protein